MTAQTAIKNDMVKLQVPSAAIQPQLIQALASVLGSTYVLYQKSLFYHWNVEGANFYGLHNLFEGHYEELHKAGDIIAERIRALGFTAPGTLHDFLTLSVIEEDKQIPENALMMIRNLIDSHERCANEAQRTIAIAENEKDNVTVDLMVQRIAFHDKAAWMLRSISQEKKTEQPYPAERL